MAVDLEQPARLVVRHARHRRRAQQQEAAAVNINDIAQWVVIALLAISVGVHSHPLLYIRNRRRR